MSKGVVARPILVEQDWGNSVSLEKVDDTLKTNPGIKFLAFVHAETSTGALSDARELAAIAQRHDCLTIVDAVTSLAGVPLKVDEWALDAVYSGSQKCLSCTPGLSPVTFSTRAEDCIKARKTPIQSWFMDLNLVMGYWGSQSKRAYHHTAPVNSLYGLHESLVMLRQEGLEESWKKHLDMHKGLKAGLKALGLQLVVQEGSRIPHLNAVRVPDGCDEALIRASLLSEFGIEIGAGLGALAGKVWRIGIMGNSCTIRNVTTLLAALETLLARQDVVLQPGQAVTKAIDAYNEATAENDFIDRPNEYLLPVKIPAKLPHPRSIANFSLV